MFMVLMCPARLMRQPVTEDLPMSARNPLNGTSVQVRGFNVFSLLFTMINYILPSTVARWVTPIFVYPQNEVDPEKTFRRKSA
jgi:hypothetical protein